MAVIGSASLNITPSFEGFQGKLEGDTSKAMTAAGATGGAKFGDSAGKSAGSRFRGHIKSAAKIAALGLAAVGAVAFKFAGDSLEEAREAQKVGALTESTIKATGKAAQVTAKHVGNLSGRISKKVGIDDEAIQSGANMLLTFKNIRNEAGEGNKVFDQTLTTLVDMSSAMGTDAKTSAIQLGKALNDPVKGISALSRVGVTFTEQQKDQIAALVKAGDTMGAQKVILRELKGEFGGAARAQATEADKLSVAWGNFKEEIGTQLLPVMDDLSRFLRKKGIPAARDFAGWVRDDLIPAAKDAAEEMKPLIGAVKDLAGFINDLPKPAKIAGIAAVLGGVGFAKLRGGNLGGGGALGTIGKVTGLAKPVPVFVTNPGFGGAPGGAPGGKAAGIGAKVAKIGGPAAIVGGAAYGLGKFFDWNHEGDNPIEHMFGGKVGDMARDFFDSANDGAKEYDKSLGVVNNAWAKVGQTTDGARERVRLYDGTLRGLPKEWQTVVKAVNLESVLWGAKQYKGMLDGLDGRTVTTFLKSVRVNDIGEGTGTSRPHNASGTSFWRGGPTWVGENGRELLDVPRGSSITPGNQVGGDRLVLEIDGEQFDARVRRIADGRAVATARHNRATGRV